ncbi:MAG: nucleotidyltransferase family protein [Candidatus Eisenbacteria bacterium]
MGDRTGPVAAVILAAGYASRIGRPKALLPLGEDTVLGRVIRTCREGGASPIHVVTGHRAAPVESAVRDSGVTLVRNTRYPEGQLSSLQAGFRSLPGGLAAVLPCPVDYPLITGAVPRLLIRAFREEREGARIFVPTFQGRRGHPYLVEAALTAEYLALGEGRTGRDVIRADPGRVREVPVPEEGILHDLDTPDDYVRIRRILGRTG